MFKLGTDSTLPEYKVSRLKILTGYLFRRQKRQKGIFVRRFRYMYQKGSVILQVKSSLQMTHGLHGQSKLALCNQTIRCNLRILVCIC